MTQPNTTETLTVTILRKELATHQREAVYRASKGMFYTAKSEIDACIRISSMIAEELIMVV